MPATLKLAFAGTPEIAASILQKLIASDLYEINAVYTQADKPAGRGRKIHASAVKRLANARGMTLYQPASPATIDVGNVLEKVDLLVVVAYGMLLPASILQRPRLGCINVHTSLLPRWRGAAPIQRAIQAGDSESGITVMQMDAGLDTGDILLQRACSIHPVDTAGTLHDRLAMLGGEVLLEALALLRTGSLQPRPQEERLATYAAKISKAEAGIDWRKSAGEIERSVRAFNPFPVAHTTVNNLQMRVWEVQKLDSENGRATPGTVLSSNASGIEVACGQQSIRITMLQLAGKKVISAAEFHNSHQNFCSAQRDKSRRTRTGK